jgi:hypothetical protein
MARTFEIKGKRCHYKGIVLEKFSSFNWDNPDRYTVKITEVIKGRLQVGAVRVFNDRTYNISPRIGVWGAILE